MSSQQVLLVEAANINIMFIISARDNNGQNSQGECEAGQR